MLIKARIDKIIGHYNNDYTILKAKVLDYEITQGEKVEKELIRSSMTIKGYGISECIEKDIYMINAKLQFDDYGYFLYSTDSYLSKIELDIEFEKYLVNHIKGIGKSKAKKIMQHLGQNAIEVISSENGVDKLSEIVSVELAIRIVADFMKHKNLYEIMTFLYVNRLGAKTLNDIIDEYGLEKAEELNSNPYVFSKVIDFNKLDKIAFERSDIQYNDQRRLIAGITSYVAKQLAQGNLYTDIDDVYKNVADYINSVTPYKHISPSMNEIKQAIAQIRIDNILTIKNGRYLYMKNIANKEDNICYNLKRLNRIDPTYSRKQIKEAIEVFEKDTKIKLSDEQTVAVIEAIQNNLSILTGLPGSGKTLTIKAIIYVIKILNPNINIEQIAPTGKASKRMTQVSGLSAQTIHRALKLKGDKGNGTNIESDFIIIDESSMIDVYLIDTLLHNVKDETKVLIAGDVEQLPSIGPGLILRDMINSDVIPTTRLTKLFRQAENSRIITNAHAIAKKTMDFNFEPNTDAVLWKSLNEDEIYKHAKITYKRMLELKQPRKEIVLLSPIRGGKIGTESINKMIQENFNIGTKEVQIRCDFKLKEKDIVMHIENNYDLNVFNGEVGTVSKVYYDKDDNPIVEVKYDDKEEVVVYEKENLKQLELAYCITVHKSQGSEYKNVISIISDTHSRMLNGNLIYTAWTRAKDRLIVLGTMETIIDVIGKKDNSLSRNSNLEDILRGVEFKRDVPIQDYIDEDEVF